MFSLLELPSELVLKILSFTARKELKNVNLCNKSLHKSTIKRLWQRVKIQWKWLITIDWDHSVTKQQFSNLLYAKSVNFYDEYDDVEDTDNPGFDDFIDILEQFSPVDKEKAREKIIDNYKKLLGYFSCDDVDSLSTSRGGEAIVLACRFFQKLKKLDLSNIVNIPSVNEDENPLRYVAELELEELDISGNVINIYNMISLFNLDNRLWNLKVLDLSDNPSCLDNGGHFLLSSLIHLEVLDLSGCRFRDFDNAINSISSAKSLRHLTISNTKVTDIGLKQLSMFESLETLDMFNCSKITDDGLEFLSISTSIKFLSIGCSKRVTDIGITYLKKLKNLRHLNISAMRLLTDKCLDQIMEMKTLELLNIHPGRFHENKFSLQALNRLSAHPSLKEVSLSRQPFCFQCFGTVKIHSPDKSGLLRWPVFCYDYNR